MGSLAFLFVAGDLVGSFKNGVDPTVLTMFTEADRCVYGRQVPAFVGDSEEPQGGGDEAAYEYSCTAAAVRQRLEVMGFTLAQSEAVYEAGVEEGRSTLGWLEAAQAPEARERIAERLNDAAAAAPPFRQWLERIRERLADAATRERPHYLIAEEPEYLRSLSLGNRAFTNEADPRYLVRAIVEVCPAGADVVLDFTDLVIGGWVDADDVLCLRAREHLSHHYLAHEKVVVLTEGSSDRDILEATLGVLYPHLVEYYAFADFGAANAAGGASALIQTVKALVASGMRNRIIALFDSDTAADEHRRGLGSTKIPDNIKILALPPLDLARTYPTLVPAGLHAPTRTVDVDVNGLAGSIELYLGTDVLKDASGRLTPVQWKSYSSALRRYQGELVDKERVRQRFWTLLAGLREHPELMVLHDWEPMRLVFEAIFAAFNS